MGHYTRTCLVEWCARTPSGRGLCNAHYQRSRRGGDMDAPIRSMLRVKRQPTCTHPGCDFEYHSNGYCALHWSRWRVGGDMDAPRVERRRRGAPPVPCSVSGCVRGSDSRGMCSKHYLKWYAKSRKVFCSVPSCGGRLHAKGLCQSHYSIELSFGITAQEWERIFQGQRERCAVCALPLTRAQAHTDHDHSCCKAGKTGCGKCVRGILCRSCNLGLGNFKDSATRLESAIKYLSDGFGLDHERVLRVS